MTTEKYQIISKKQLGYFVLNSSINDNKDLENIYGNISYEDPKNLDLDSFKQVDKIFSDAGIEIDGLDDLKKSYIENQNKLHEIIYDCGIALIYIDKKLFEITAHKECVNVNYNNHYIFKEHPKDIVDLFCSTLDEYPLINKQDIYFPKSHLTFWSFSEDVTPDGKIKWANENSEFYSEKSFTMYAGPRNDDQTYDDYIIYKPDN